jgi:hypothetical protein
VFIGFQRCVSKFIFIFAGYAVWCVLNFEIFIWIVYEYIKFVVGTHIIGLFGFHFKQVSLNY